MTRTLKSGRTNWLVTVDLYKCPLLKDGEITRTRTWEHRTRKAAFRRLGSLINGTQKAETDGPVRVYALNLKDQKRYTWMDLRNLINEGAL